MGLNTNFLNEYNGLAVHQAGSLTLGIGTFRCYLNSTSKQLDTGDYGVSRWFALTTIQDTVFANIADREVADYTSSMPWAGKSTGSININGITFSAGITIYGDFTNIKLTSGTILVYGL